MGGASSPPHFLYGNTIMDIKNGYVNRVTLKKIQARRAKLATQIETRSQARIKRSLRLRYIGLVLVQGSSALALLSFPMITYWTALWFGLVCYQITAVTFYREDNKVYRDTKLKYERRQGSSKSTIDALALKRKREIVYIIGNTIGLILIGANILTG